MKVTIYVEGGSKGHKAAMINCRKGFTLFFARMLPGNNKVAVEPRCGRAETYRDFCTSLKNAEKGHVSLLLVDSEEAVKPNVAPWEHLRDRQGDGWKKPASARENDVHLMVQSVESWFLADPAQLGVYYGKGFKAEKLPKPVNGDVECHDKQKVMKGLNTAVKETVHKHYEKSHGFDIVGGIDPAQVCKVSVHARHLKTRLLELLGDRSHGA